MWRVRKTNRVAVSTQQKAATMERGKEKEENTMAKFRVDRTMMRLFYRCSIESVLTFSFICYYASLTVRQKDVVACVCSKITGSQQKLKLHSSFILTTEERLHVLWMEPLLLIGPPFTESYHPTLQIPSALQNISVSFWLIVAAARNAPITPLCVTGGSTKRQTCNVSD